MIINFSLTDLFLVKSCNLAGTCIYLMIRIQQELQLIINYIILFVFFVGVLILIEYFKVKLFKSYFIQLKISEEKKNLWETVIAEVNQIKINFILVILRLLCNFKSKL